MKQFSVLDYIFFVVSLLLCAAVGIYYLVIEKRQKRQQRLAGSKLTTNDILLIRNNNGNSQNSPGVDEDRIEAVAVAKSAREYFFGNKNLAMLPVVCSLFASFISAVGILGLPAEVYTTGSITLLTPLTFIIAAPIIAFIYIPIFYQNKFRSIFEYVEARFCSRVLRKVTALSSAMCMICHAAVCAYIPCAALTVATGIPEWIIIVATGLVTVFYTTIGGLRAVIWVDTIQAAIMFCGVVACLIVGTLKIGGLPVAWEVSNNLERIAILNWDPDPIVTHSFWAVLIGGTSYWVSNIGTNQAMLQRCCAMPTLTKAKWSLILVAPVVFFMFGIIWLTSLVAFAYFNGVTKCDPLSTSKITNPNQVLPYFVQEVMNYPGYLGIFYSCLFSGSISSVSTVYNSVSSLIWEDWMRPILEPRLSKRQILITVQALTAFVGILVGVMTILAKYVGGTAIKAVLSFTGSFLGSIHAIYFCGAFLPFVTSSSLVVGMSISLPLTLSILVYQIIAKPYSHPWLPLVTSGCSKVIDSASSIINGTDWTTEIILTESSRLLETTQSVLMTSSISRVNKFLVGVITEESELLLSSPAPDADMTNSRTVANTILSLSYTYFPLFSMLVGVLVAVIVSLINIALFKCYSRVAWLKPRPAKVDPNLLASHFFKRFAFADDIGNGVAAAAEDEKQAEHKIPMSKNNNCKNNKSAHRHIHEGEVGTSLPLTAPVEPDL